MSRPPLVVLGPTAAGKSNLAIELALLTPGAPIITADAMAVYKPAVIGTAKISVAEQRGIPHHLVDVVPVASSYGVAMFQSAAGELVSSIRAAGKDAIIAGGTGLYVRSLVDDLQMPPSFPEIREQADAEPIELLWQELCKSDPEAASRIEDSNKRRIVRAIEVIRGTGKKFSSFGPGMEAYGETDYVQIGLEIDRDILDLRIDARIDLQLEQGLLSEVKSLSSMELSKTAGQALAYKELLAHLAGEMTLEEAVELIRLRTKRFARRQQRWFRRDPRIIWLPHDSPTLVQDALAAWN